MKAFFDKEAFCVGAEVNFNQDAIDDMDEFAREMILRSPQTIIARDIQKDVAVGVAVNTIIVSKCN